MIKSKKKPELSMDDEMLMWCAYRYAIGRKTYVQKLASHIAKKYYSLLSEGRMEFASLDIRREIQEHFRWWFINFHYDGSVREADRKPYEDLIQFIMDEVVTDDETTEQIEEKLLKIKDVEVYHESYKDGEPHKYRVTYRPEGDSRKYISPSDLNDYQCWAALAACFDKKNYKKVHVKYDGKEEDIICFETWAEDCKPIESQPGYYQYWPWHWKKVYIDVDHFVNGDRGGYVYEPNIVSVEDYDAREDKTDDRY